MASARREVAEDDRDHFAVSAQDSGNVLMSGRDSGLPTDSVANLSQIVTIDPRELAQRAGKLPHRVADRGDRGLRLVLEL
jgi:mRNA interferase MazF